MREVSERKEPQDHLVGKTAVVDGSTLAGVVFEALLLRFARQDAPVAQAVLQEEQEKVGRRFCEKKPC